MAEAAIMAASLAVSAYSTYQQGQAADAANATAKKTIQGQEDAQGAADKALLDKQGKNEAMQSQDAQWMTLKTAQNSSQGLATAAPYSLTAQSGAAGAAAGSNAGKLK
jgi:hypothetical protein